MEAEWPVEGLKDWGPFGQVPFSAWDADQDAAVTSVEGRRLIEVAYGIRRPDGELIRLPTGLSVDWMTMRRLDKNGDGQLSREEFVASYWAGEQKNEELFKNMDTDGDGQTTLAEIRVNPVMTYDVVGHFLWWDTSLNGRLDQEELLAKSAPWQQSLGMRLMPAFDVDGNGELSLMEFRKTPFANPASDWYFLRQDADADSELSFSEFYKESAPSLVGLYSEVFTRLDRDHNRTLSYDELEFGADWSKAKTDVRFKVADRNHDGQLTIAELFTKPAPANDSLLIARHERLRKYHQDWLEQADSNHDGSLSGDEFAQHILTFLPAVLESFVNLDKDGDGQLNYQEYTQPTVGTKWEAFAKVEAPLFDVNDDGFLNWKEYRISPRGTPTVEQRFEGLDANGDGRLSENEYLHIIPSEQRRSARRTFCHIDSDGDGFTSREEWLGQGKGPLSVKTEFRSRDDDGDGHLTMEEFLGPVGEQWQAHGRRDFRVVDQDRDQKLSLNEFRCIPTVAGLADRGEIADPVVVWMERQLTEVTNIFRRQDRDSDGRLSLREWPGGEITAASPDLGSIPTKIWDRDHDGYVVLAECRSILELAYGIRLPDGSAVRLPTGLVVNVAMLRQFDTDKDGMLSKSEFLSKFWLAPQKNLEIFNQHDQNKDGRWNWAEIQTSPEMTTDILGQFLWLDTDLDGLVDQHELDARMATWQKSVGSRLMRAFCTSGDGRMSFQEFRSTPLANPVADWYAPRNDKDHDAKLSWSEFYDETFPLLIGLYREYFNRFDLDKDGSLTYDELEFSVDLAKVTPEIAFRMQDKNGDGRLVLSEVFTEPKPTTKDKDVIERYEMRLGVAETKFLADDANRDGALDVAEFQQSKEAALKAVERKTKALSRHRKNQPSNLPFIAFVVLDVLVLIGAGWYVWKWAGRRNS